MDNDIIMAMDAIKKINALLFEEEQEENLLLNDGTSYPLEIKLETNDNCIKIYYLGFCIWFSLEDERNYNEKKDCYESLVCFLKRKVNAINEALGKIFI